MFYPTVCFWRKVVKYLVNCQRKKFGMFYLYQLTIKLKAKEICKVLTFIVKFLNNVGYTKLKVNN